MKKETKKLENTIINNVEIETIETTPEDGFVHDSVIRPTKMQHYGKDNTMYHKGYSKTFTYTTNDPRITRPFIKIMCGIFLTIGLVMLLLFRDLFFGIIFISVSIFAYFKANKDIDKVAEELKQQGKDVTIDSKEEAEQIKNEFVGTIKGGMNDVIASTFTKNNFKWFIKAGLPIYAIVVILVSLLLGIFVSIFLGLFIFGLLTIGGFLYFFILSKIFKH